MIYLKFHFYIYNNIKNIYLDIVNIIKINTLFREEINYYNFLFFKKGYQFIKSTV